MIKIKIKDDRLKHAISSDERAEKEANLFSSEELAEIGENNSWVRKQRFLNCLTDALIRVFWVFLTGVVILAGVWFYHMVTPLLWHFLNPDQQDKVQTMLFSGIISAAATGSTKRFIR